MADNDGYMYFGEETQGVLESLQRQIARQTKGYTDSYILMMPSYSEAQSDRLPPIIAHFDTLGQLEQFIDDWVAKLYTEVSTLTGRYFCPTIELPRTIGDLRAIADRERRLLGVPEFPKSMQYTAPMPEWLCGGWLGREIMHLEPDENETFPLKRAAHHTLRDKVDFHFVTAMAYKTLDGCSHLMYNQWPVKVVKKFREDS